MTEIQHFMDGIPSGSIVVDPVLKESWEVKKRVLIGSLLASDSETYFDSETDYEHVHNSFGSEEAQISATQNELEKRKKGIYWYLLTSRNPKCVIKPTVGSVLKIEVIT